jgi:hypothetical protein
MIIYIYRYDYNPKDKDPWKDAWITPPSGAPENIVNDFHSMRYDGSKWSFVSHYYQNYKDDPSFKIENPPDPSNPDSYWTNRPKPKEIPTQRYCCTRKRK